MSRSPTRRHIATASTPAGQPSLFLTGSNNIEIAVSLSLFTTHDRTVATYIAVKVAVDRLRSHAKAFDGLLNLIPAKLYFSQDNSDQWKKRKQTREESQAAKRAKLDPDQPVTVKEVEEERVRQRSEREEKRRKLNEDGVPYETKSQMKARRKEEKRRERRDRKQGEGGESPKKSRPEGKGRQEVEQNGDVVEMVSPSKEQHHPAKRKDVKVNGDRIQVNGTQKTGKAIIHKTQPVLPTPDEDDEGGESDDGSDGMSEEEDSSSEDEQANEPVSEDDSDSEVDAEVGEEDSSDDGSEAGHADKSIQQIEGLTSTIDSNASPAPSNTTDASSTAQKSLAEKLKTSKDPAIQQQLKERLAKRIEELRQARKADGGEAPRTRTELMDQRRKRDELRKERKKQMRLQAKAEAAKAGATQNGEFIDGAPSSSSSVARKSDKAVAPANYTFGQVNFDDGDKLKDSLDGTKSSSKKRGPMDVLGALKHAEAKKARLSNMPEEKRADIQEKDRWSKALKMAAGEKLQDDEGLLKKSLKRQEKAKKKSKREWKERNAGVEKAKAMRQKKREANIAARKEQKKAGKSGKKARKVPSKKAKGRAGFEGTGFGGAGRKNKSKA
ncbi:hypothetical protein Dda_2334 [Drechslerella dactyloides]|uniref:SURF6-domain-containing protein n=1 Tax=Drechslerella dactyloides TaxID=74499 RepID=A0AAD6J3H2_DREDA|nr:hypothetical protein Dda_2334 [Drechslerella dactyloides]